MNTRNIKKYKRRVRYGLPELRMQKVVELKPEILYDACRLEERLRQLRYEANNFRSARTSQPIDKNARPVAISQDTSYGLMCRIGAIIAILVELAVSYLVARSSFAKLAMLCLMGLLLPFIIERILLVRWRNDHNPSETIDKLSFGLIPALLMLATAIAVLAAARIATGELAIWLKDLTSFALVILTIGCIIGSAMLLALARVYLTSKRYETEYTSLEQEYLRTVRFGSHLGEIEREIRTSSSTVLSRAIPLLLLFVMMASFSGCNNHNLSASVLTDTNNRVKDDAPTTAHHPLRINVYLDWTKSADDAAFKSAIESFVTQLPDVIEQTHAENIAIYHFGDDGWTCEQVFEAKFPALISARAAENDFGESAAIFDNVRDAQVIRERDEVNKANQVIQNQNRERIEQELAKLSSSMLLPPSYLSEPRCSDINGLLGRIAASPTSSKELNFVISDAGETCSENLQFNDSDKTFAVVFVLLPEQTDQRKDAARADEQFMMRRAKIAELLPSAVVQPPFSNNFIEAAQTALSRRAVSEERVSQD